MPHEMDYHDDPLIPGRMVRFGDRIRQALHEDDEARRAKFNVGSPRSGRTHIYEQPVSFIMSPTTRRMLNAVLKDFYFGR